ncbi:MAG: NAD(P)/FAD-dependent oxidoreductase [Puia sp.]|nr:NAD(P)/FAD-dependent oxidoreductase [Puia sp.]
MSDTGKILLVIGGGAAGLFCAVNAARLDPSLKVIVAEKSGKLLSKVRVSGGGRCNLTHACPSIGDMAQHYPRGAHFVKKTFHQFFVTDTIEWFESRDVPLKTEEDGRMFPLANTSQAVIDCLMREVNTYRVEMRMNREVKEVKLLKEERTPEIGKDAKTAPMPGTGDAVATATKKFAITFNNGERLEADFVCIACGGYPKSSMFDWLRALGHTIEEPVPSLFTFNMPGHSLNALMGVSVPEAQIRITGSKAVTDKPSNDIQPHNMLSGSKLREKGPVLVTHWGLSGPAILRLSAWGARELAACGYEFDITINWIPAYNEQSAAKELQRLRFELASQKVVGKNPFGLPSRLWEWLASQAGIGDSLRWADLPAASQNKLVRNLCVQPFSVKGKTTFKEEFVTAGGVKLSEVDPNTMQSRKLPGLFFAGEIVDVDGITGGYNFQHAWTSGFIAAKTIAGGAIVAP